MVRLPRPAHWLPCCIAGCCVPTAGVRVGTGPLGRPLPAPLAPSALFWVCSVQEDPRLGGPTTLTSKSVVVSPFTDSARPRSFPSPWGLGWLLPGFCCWSQGGQHELWGFSGYTPAGSHGPVLEVPAAGWRGQHPSAGHCAAWPSCQRIVGGSPHGQYQGSCLQGRGLGKGWSWEGVGAGSSTGDIFVTAIVRANGNGMILSYCCQRDVSLLLLWECGWGLVWFCVFVSY